MIHANQRLKERWDWIESMYEVVRWIMKNRLNSYKSPKWRIAIIFKWEVNKEFVEKVVIVTVKWTIVIILSRHMFDVNIILNWFVV